MTLGMIALQRKKRKSTASLTEVFNSIKHQVPVAPVLSSKAIHAQSSTMPMEEGGLDFAVPAKLLELSENAKTAFFTLFNSMKAVCIVYDTDFRQLIESQEMETGDGLLGILDLELTDPPYSVRSEAGNASSEHDPFIQEGIRDLVELYSEFMPLGVYGHILCAWLQIVGGTTCC